jgi:hypothetical protein
MIYRYRYYDRCRIIEPDGDQTAISGNFREHTETAGRETGINANYSSILSNNKASSKRLLVEKETEVGI